MLLICHKCRYTLHHASCRCRQQWDDEVKREICHAAAVALHSRRAQAATQAHARLRTCTHARTYRPCSDIACGVTQVPQTRARAPNASVCAVIILFAGRVGIIDSDGRRLRTSSLRCPRSSGLPRRGEAWQRARARADARTTTGRVKSNAKRLSSEFRRSRSTSKRRRSACGVICRCAKARLLEVKARARCRCRRVYITYADSGVRARAHGHFAPRECRRTCVVEVAACRRRYTLCEKRRAHARACAEVHSATAAAQGRPRKKLSFTLGNSVCA